MPNPELWIIVGMPGSGKSWTSRSKGIPEERIFDDCCWSWRPENRQVLGIIDALKSGQDCVANDVAFCDRSELAKFLDGITQHVQDCGIAFHYFENNPKTCKINCAYDYIKEIQGRLSRPSFDRRSAKRFLIERLETIERLTQIYQPPADGEIHSIGLSQIA